MGFKKYFEILFPVYFEVKYVFINKQNALPNLVDYKTEYSYIQYKEYSSLFPIAKVCILYIDKSLIEQIREINRDTKNNST